VNTLPLVSIIISAYNAERYLIQTLDSVLNQTWPNLEIIVVNDGSTDSTLQIAQSYGDRGVKVISQENKGQDAALNFGYKHSNGSYIKFMDSDDLVNQEMIEIQMRTLNGSHEYIAYSEWTRFYNKKPELAQFTLLDYWKDMDPVDFLTARPEGVMLQCGIMLVPRPIIDKGGLWDERLILFNDTEFFTRVLLCSKGIKFSPGARLFYRSAISSSITSGRTRKFYESTFLATNLIAKHMLAAEDSTRVRILISNTYLSQYYRMYPNFPDLRRAHEKEIAFYGGGTINADGGKVFKLLKALAGWKTAMRIQSFFYKIGYKPVHPGLKFGN
jgi:glycosyltransferase involved in cell wall biosynthesis